MVAKDIVEDNLQRPRLKQVRNALTNNRDEGERESEPVREKQIGDANLFLGHDSNVRGALSGAVARP